MLAKFSGLNPKEPYVSFEKEKQNFCVVLTYSIRRARQIRKFHVAVMQQRLRNVQKSAMHAQRCFFFFAKLNLLFLCCSPSPLQKLPIVVIQQFCYHGNVTSHLLSFLAFAPSGFSWDAAVFFSPQKPTFLTSNSDLQTTSFPGSFLSRSPGAK